MTSVNGDFRSTSTYLPLSSKNRDLTEIQSKTNEVSQDGFGNTELHKACFHPMNMDLIRSYSINPKHLLVKNKFSELPLHILCRSDRQGGAVIEMLSTHPDIITELLTSKDCNNATPVQVVEIYRSDSALRKIHSFISEKNMRF